jgi:hypothetical protein
MTAFLSAINKRNLWGTLNGFMISGPCHILHLVSPWLPAVSPYHTTCERVQMPTTSAPVEAMEGRHVRDLLDSPTSRPPHVARAVADADRQQHVAPTPALAAHDGADQRGEGACGIQHLLLRC